jgi:ribosome-binding protein aMBF1 (putative translation factor)
MSHNVLQKKLIIPGKTRCSGCKQFIPSEKKHAHNQSCEALEATRIPCELCGKKVVPNGLSVHMRGQTCAFETKMYWEGVRKQREREASEREQAEQEQKQEQEQEQEQEQVQEQVQGQEQHQSQSQAVSDANDQDGDINNEVADKVNEEMGDENKKILPNVVVADVPPSRSRTSGAPPRRVIARAASFAPT